MLLLLFSPILILLLSIYFNYYFDFNVFTYILRLCVKTLNFIWFNLNAIFKTTLMVIIFCFLNLKDTSNYSTFKLILHFCVIWIIGTVLFVIIGTFLDIIPTIELSSDPSLPKPDSNTKFTVDVGSGAGKA